jgi:hypothetical protein
MSNTLLTIDMITADALPLFVNSNAFLQNINRQYSDEFKETGAKIGETVRIRLPSDYTTTLGPNLDIQGDTQVNTSLTVSTQRHVDIAFTSVEQRMELSQFRELVLKPAINNLAGAVAADVAALAETVPNFVGNFSGNAIVSPTKTQFLQAGAILSQNSATKGGRMAILDPATSATVADSMTSLFNPSKTISDQFDNGMMSGSGLGIGKWMEDQTVLAHTTAEYGTLPTVTGVGAGGTSINVSETTAPLNAGDIFTIAGVFAVNRVTKQSQTYLMQFVITAAVPTGSTSIPIYPALIAPSGANPVQFQTVAQSPANGAAISVVTPAGSVFKKNLVMRPEAFTLGMVDLPLYGAGIIAGARQNYQGCSLRIIDAYLPQSDQKVTRIDVLYGFAALRPEWACVVPDMPSF